MDKRQLSVACLQTRPMADFQSALDEALARAEEAVAVGANLLLLPEYCGGLKTVGRAFAPPVADESSHPVLAGLREFAAAKQVWMVIGSIAIADADKRFYNRGFVIDNTGGIRARYNKLHLFDIELNGTQYRESDTVIAGQDAVLCDTPFGRLGYTICYDLRFPNLYRKLAQAGAEILLVPAAFTKKTGQAHWHVLNRARAIETGSFVVSPCAIGKVDGGGESYGHSLIVNPWGEVLADGGAEPGMVHAAIDLDEVAAARAQIPSWNLEHEFDITNESEASTAGRDVA